MIRRSTIVAVGRLKGWAAEGCEDYLARLRRYFPVEVVEVPEADMNRNPPQDVLAAEAENLVLWPGMIVAQGIHPSCRDGEWPPLFTSRRILAYEVAGHALFGALLGSMLRQLPDE